MDGNAAKTPTQGYDYSSPLTKLLKGTFEMLSCPCCAGENLHIKDARFVTEEGNKRVAIDFRCEDEACVFSTFTLVVWTSKGTSYAAWQK